ncbi:hypothetical protein M2344_002107 [Sphingobium sp. B8D3C]|nr:hypothetical protein [Sphingobium sp. B8D3B]MCW2419145.1 hypothetical protein [Sphingobium sp. B8D3C]
MRGYRAFARRCLALGILATLPAEPGLAQGTVLVPVGGDSPPAVPQSPPVDPDDKPEDIAKDAARDLKDTRFYNKPGATRADYDRDWQECRLIARGSRTPAGTVPYYYNPAVISPLAAGIGGGLGGLIGGMIVQGEQRRANRRQCLLIRGWRLVEAPKSRQESLLAMGDAQRDAYFDGIVGAQTVEGEVTTRTSFTQVEDPALTLDAPTAGPGSLFAGKKIDPGAAIALGENEGLVVLAFRRPMVTSAGRSASVSLARYDVEKQDLVYQPRDWKKTGDGTTYRLNIASADKKQNYEVQLIRVTAGDYALENMVAGPAVATSSNCFGAPRLHVAPGSVVYAGDFVPVMGASLSTGQKVQSAMFWTSNIEQARTLVSSRHADLAARMAAAQWHNQATYACSAVTMDRYDLPERALASYPDSSGPTAASESVEPVAAPETSEAPPSAEVASVAASR